MIGKTAELPFLLTTAATTAIRSAAITTPKSVKVMEPEGERAKAAMEESAAIEPPPLQHLMRRMMAWSFVTG